jgi:hypothetical protein
VHEREQESRVNPAGNERLTAAVGLLVLVPVLVEIASVLLGGHTFMSLHVFVGLALIPAVLLKLGSTGWRFPRYYTRSRAYVAGGPPQIAMRLLAPVIWLILLGLHVLVYLGRAWKRTAVEFAPRGRHGCEGGPLVSGLSAQQSCAGSSWARRPFRRSTAG